MSDTWPTIDCSKCGAPAQTWNNGCPEDGCPTRDDQLVVDLVCAKQAKMAELTAERDASSHAMKMATEALGLDRRSVSWADIVTAVDALRQDAERLDFLEHRLVTLTLFGTARPPVFSLEYMSSDNEWAIIDGKSLRSTIDKVRDAARDTAGRMG